MQDLVMEILEIIKKPDAGIMVIAIAAITVAGMSVYGMILALKKR